MDVNLLNITPTQKVVARLRSEGWIDCPGLEMPALSQYPLSNPLELRSLIQTQLYQSNGWMWQDDLYLAALIFSIPDHRFEVHPALQSTLKQLELEGLIAFEHAQPLTQKSRTAIAVLLKDTSAPQLVPFLSGQILHPQQGFQHHSSVFEEFVQRN